MSVFVDEIIKEMDEYPDNYLFVKFGPWDGLRKLGTEIVICRWGNGIWTSIVSVWRGNEQTIMTNKDHRELERAVHRWFAKATVKRLIATPTTV